MDNDMYDQLFGTDDEDSENFEKAASLTDIPGNQVNVILTFLETS